MTEIPDDIGVEEVAAHAAKSVVEHDFTTDWSSSRDYWPAMFEELGLTGQPNLRFLEIGCFEGQASLWLMENVLTDPSSKLAVIDPFDIVRGEHTNGYRFGHNLAPWIGTGRLAIHTGRSQTILREWGTGWATYEKFDFIYVDGSHESADALADAVLSWPLLKPGGVMVFDDYQWDDVVLEWQKPQIAVDAFVRCYQSRIASAKRRGMDQFVVVKA